nr:MAG TPA: U6 snRNA-associated Sm-like protein [Caudoviricetes sp.]
MILEHTNLFHDDSYILTSTEKPPASGGFFCEVCVYTRTKDRISTLLLYL